jgi:iron complex outermembrane receptor protein
MQTYLKITILIINILLSVNPIKSDILPIFETELNTITQDEESVKSSFALKQIADEVISGDQLRKTHATNILDALQASISLLFISNTDGGINGGKQVLYKGASLIGAQNLKPVFIIDGVVIENSISGADEWGGSPSDWGNELKNISVNNVEYIFVLNPLMASIKYGSRAKNGAVVITTKNHNSNKQLDVHIAQTIGLNQVSSLPDFQYQYGPGSVAGYVNYGQKDLNGNYYRFGSSTQFKNQVYNNREYPTLIGSSGLLFGPKFDSREIIGWEGKIINYSAQEKNYKNLYRRGLVSNTQVTISGKNNFVSFYIAGDLASQEDVHYNVSNNRNSILFKTNLNLIENLKINTALDYTKTSPKNTPVGIGFLKNSVDLSNYRDNYQASHGGIPSESYGDDLASVPNIGYWFSVFENNAQSEELFILPQFKIEYTLNRWLSAKFNWSKKIYEVDKETKSLGGGYQNQGGHYEISNYETNESNQELQINAWHKFDQFLWQFNIGYQQSNLEAKYLESSTNGGFIVPGIFSLSNSRKEVKAIETKYDDTQISSFYANLSLEFKNQIFLNLSTRRESIQINSSDNEEINYFFSPSWIISNSFNLDEFIDLWKLKLSYGLVKAPNYRKWFNEYVVENKSYIDLSTNIRLLNNRLNLKLNCYVENVEEENKFLFLPQQEEIYGGELSTKGLNLAFQIIPIRTKDLTWDLNFSYHKQCITVDKLNSIYDEYKLLCGTPNSGNYRIGSVALKNGELGALMSDSKPTIYQAYDENGGSISHKHNGMKVLRCDEYRRGANYVREGGKPKKIGKILPDFTGFFGSSIKYKQFDLSVNLAYRYGGHIASYTNRYGTAYGYTNSSLDARDVQNGGITWKSDYSDTKDRMYSDGIIPDGVFEDGTIVTTPNGTKQNIGGMTFQDAYSKGYVEPVHASFYHNKMNSWETGVISESWVNEVKYIALRQLSFGYEFPDDLLTSFYITNLKISVVGKNLGYLYNSLPNNLNPESVRGNNSMYSFFERTITPVVSTYSFKIELNLF